MKNGSENETFFGIDLAARRGVYRCRVAWEGAREGRRERQPACSRGNARVPVSG